MYELWNALHLHVLSHVTCNPNNNIGITAGMGLLLSDDGVIFHCYVWIQKPAARKSVDYTNSLNRLGFSTSPDP